MAPSNGHQVDEQLRCHGEVEEAEKALKYLGFVEGTAGVVTVCVVHVYAVAKDWSGAWRPYIEDLEKRVRDTVGPLYHLVHGKEHDILLFFDHKVDVLVSSLRKHSPHLLRTALHVSLKVATSAPDVLADVMAEIKKVGVAETVRDYTQRCLEVEVEVEPAVSKWAVSAWHQVMKVPLMSGLVVHVLCPHVLRLGRSFNAILVELQEKQVPLVSSLPLLPMDHFERNVMKKEA